MSQLWVKTVSINNLSQDIGKVVLDEHVNICSFHLIDVFNGWKETILWRSSEDLSQVCFTIDELE